MKKMYEPKSALNLKSLVVLSRTVQTVQRQEIQTIQSAGLTKAQFGVLEVLYHKGDMRISDVMNKILSTSGNMTVVISNLVKTGFITKHKDPGDSRATVISLTTKGEILMKQVFPAHVENINGIFSKLDTHDKKELIRLLKKLSGIS